MTQFDDYALDVSVKHDHAIVTTTANGNTTRVYDGPVANLDQNQHRDLVDLFTLGHQDAPPQLDLPRTASFSAKFSAPAGIPPDVHAYVRAVLERKPETPRVPPMPQPPQMPHMHMPFGMPGMPGMPGFGGNQQFQGQFHGQGQSGFQQGAFQSRGFGAMPGMMPPQPPMPPMPPSGPFNPHARSLSTGSWQWQSSSSQGGLAVNMDIREV